MSLFHLFCLPQINVLFSSWVLQPESYEIQVTFVPYFVVQTKFTIKEQRTQTFRQMMKHDHTVFNRWNGEKKINLWRGGDFKERIKPLIVRSEFRWNSSRWLGRISEKPRVRVKSRFHLQRAVACNQTPWKNQSINRSLLFVVLLPFPPFKASPCSLSDSTRSLGSKRAKITYLLWRKFQSLRNITC